MTTHTQPLTADERAERDFAAYKADNHAIAAHIRAVTAELEKRAVAAAVAEPVVPAETARDRLMPVFRAALADAEASLADQLREARLPYEGDRLRADLQRQADVWQCAVATYRPTPPLSEFGGGIAACNACARVRNADHRQERKTATQAAPETAITE